MRGAGEAGRARGAVLGGCRRGAGFKWGAASPENEDAASRLALGAWAGPGAPAAPPCVRGGGGRVWRGARRARSCPAPPRGGARAPAARRQRGSVAPARCARAVDRPAQTGPPAAACAPRPSQGAPAGGGRAMGPRAGQGGAFSRERGRPRGPRPLPPRPCARIRSRRSPPSCTRAGGAAARAFSGGQCLTTRCGASWRAVGECKVQSRLPRGLLIAWPRAPAAAGDGSARGAGAASRPGALPLQKRDDRG
jgi:hypothetical protein